MSASVTLFTSTRILSHEFVNFVLLQKGFISNEVTIDGGFSSGDSYVWFYGAKKTLEPKENELGTSDMHLPMHVSSWVYFELSSAEGSNKLMAYIFQKMGEVWPVSMRCSLYKILSYPAFAALLENEGTKSILSNHIDLFFADDVEDSIKGYLVDNIQNGLTRNNEEQDVSALPLEMESIDILKNIRIRGVNMCVSVMYEYENDDAALTEALAKVLEDTPRFFCEVYFGYGLSPLAEKSLILFLSDILRQNNGIGMGIFESTVTPDNVSSLSTYSYTRFA